MSCAALIADFSNMVKAFIGTNYLAMPFAMEQSGLVILLCLIFLVLLLNTHCCEMIVRCKRTLIDRLVNPENGVVDEDLTSSWNSTNSYTNPALRRELSDSEGIERYKKNLEKYITYSDIGNLTFGFGGKCMVEFFLALTQFLFCISYFIFIGNTVATLMFPHWPMNEIGNTTKSRNFTTMPPVVTSQPLADLHNIAGEFSHVLANGSSNCSTSPIRSKSSTWLPFIMVFPFPIFLAFAMIRKIRHISPISLVANFCLLTGFVSVIVVFSIGFTLAKNYKLFVFETFLVSLGQTVASFEGIGLIVNIEASMGENRKNFKLVLRTSLIAIGSIYAGFGALAYLRFADYPIPQMINQKLGSAFLGQSIDILLIIAVICTFPLQFFPVIEISESYLFFPGRIFGPPQGYVEEEEAPLLGDEGQRRGDGGGRGRDRGDSGVSSDDSGRENDEVDNGSSGEYRGASQIPRCVSAWKRNFLRLILMVLCVAIAVPLRDSFAYLSAITGAIGSIPMSYTIPCLIHLKVFHRQSSLASKIKDILLITFGLLASLGSLYVAVSEMIQRIHTSSHGPPCN